MSDAYFVSDAEKAEHIAAGAGTGVKRVALYGQNGGNLIQIAVNEDGSIPTTGGGTATSYNYVQKDAGSTYTYYGYASSTGWKFKRKENSTGVWTQSSGTGDFDTNWTARASKTYTYA